MMTAAGRGAAGVDDTPALRLRPHLTGVELRDYGKASELAVPPARPAEARVAAFHTCKQDQARGEEQVGDGETPRWP